MDFTSPPPRILEDPRDVQGIVLRELAAGGSKPSVIAFTHRQADPDALCAAAGFCSLVEKVAGATDLPRPSTQIVAPQGASQLGKQACQRLEIEFEEQVDPAQLATANLVAVVDAGEPALLEPYRQAIWTSPAKKVLIDHHSSKDREALLRSWDAFDELYADQNACSTCELVTVGFEERLLTQTMAQSLLVGVMFDSQHLALASEATIEAVLRLVRRGASIAAARELLRSQPDRSEVVARIKSAQRMQYLELGKYNVLKSKVSSFQASVARMLVEVGADVGIAFGDHDGEARLSARTGHQLAQNQDFDLGRLMEKIASRQTALRLVGGGHKTAASISGGVDSELLAKLVLTEVEGALPH